ncbi:MAG: hypothetical protein WC373_16905, partial [Smithella sp.]
MSEWQKLSTWSTFGSTWNIAGMGKTYVVNISTFSNDVDLWIDKNILTGGRIKGESKFWFPGNGVDSYLLAGASISFEGSTIPLKVDGKAIFYVPKEGRWSDWVSIRDWAWGHEDEYISVTFSFSMASTSAKIPTAPTAPTTPVGVSAYEYKTITEDLPETELDEEEGDLVDSLPFVENFINLDNWIIDEYGVTPTISEGLYINLPKLTEPKHGNHVDMGIIPLISHLPDKFSLEVITNCDSVPVSDWCHIVVYLYTLDYACVGSIEAADIEVPGYEKLYKPLENKTQKWRWEVDVTNISRPIERVYYDDEFIIELAGMYFFALAGSKNYPVPQSGFAFSFGNHYDTGTDCRLHIKSITITEGNTDRSLTEVTSTCTLTVTTNPDPGDTLVLKGGEQGDITFTFVDHYPNNQYEIQIGADTSETATNIATAINNYTLAEFSAEASTNTVIVTSHISGEMTIEITSTGISAGTITSTHPGLLDEEVSAADSFTVTEGGKSVQ